MPIAQQSLHSRHWGFISRQTTTFKEYIRRLKSEKIRTKQCTTEEAQLQEKEKEVTQYINLGKTRRSGTATTNNKNNTKMKQYTPCVQRGP
jgi:hypothetical protein